MNIMNESDSVEPDLEIKKEYEENTGDYMNDVEMEGQFEDSVIENFGEGEPNQNEYFEAMIKIKEDPEG